MAGMAKELSKKEIYERMKEWRNLKKLHAAARERVVQLEEKNKKQEETIRLLQEHNEQQAHTIEDLKLRVAELERMVFGRRKKKESGTDEEESSTPQDKPRAPRDPSSYHRPLPKEEDITHREHHSINSCSSCGSILTDKETVVEYEEDITLPPDPPMKTVTKRTIERGWCGSCRAWKSARPLSCASVTLGKQARLYICYLSILLRLSFAQIRLHMATSYRFHLSDGEIAKILEKESIRLRPEYEALKDHIRKEEAAHYDETGWRVQKAVQGCYAWVMTSVKSMDAVFACGLSRGKGVAEALKGNSQHTGISDDYGAYRCLFHRHQLCWAHPHRKFRDLAKADGLGEAARAQCAITFKAFGALYADVRAQVALPLEKRTIRPILARFDKVAAADPRDPKKLATLKESLRKNKDAYVYCLFHEGIPCDNNKAERSLRHLVLKRKVSFGSKTQRGADALSILASVLLSLYWRERENFFPAYLKLGV